MNDFIVRPDLHFCDVNGTYVFLDLDTQRYFLLENKASARFRRFLERSMTEDDSGWLIDNRFICRAEGTRRISRLDAVASPSRSAIDGALPRASAILTLKIALSQYTAKRQLRRKSLNAILAHLRDQKDLAASQTSSVERAGPKLLAIIAAFLASERIANSVDQCLPRSIALFTLLRHLGFAPDMVIGVSLPFAAHCWVQIGDLVVSDQLDRVRSFTPIFAL